jgi:uncharacterized protein (DUF4415 family)
MCSGSYRSTYRWGGTPWASPRPRASAAANIPRQPRTAPARESWPRPAANDRAEAASCSAGSPLRIQRIRLDDDLLEWFREQAHAAGGGSYQTLINRALRDYVAAKAEPLEETLRRVLREELPVYRTMPAKE